MVQSMQPKVLISTLVLQQIDLHHSRSRSSESSRGRKLSAGRSTGEKTARQRAAWVLSICHVKGCVILWPSGSHGRASSATVFPRTLKLFVSGRPSDAHSQMGWGDRSVWGIIDTELLSLTTSIDGRDYEVPNEVMLNDVVPSFGFTTAVVDAPAICFTGMAIYKSCRIAAMQLEVFVMEFLGGDPPYFGGRSVVIVFDNPKRDPDKLDTERRLETAARAHGCGDEGWQVIKAGLYSAEQDAQRRQMQAGIVDSLEKLLRGGEAFSRLRFVIAKVLRSSNPFVYRRGTPGLHWGCAGPEPLSSPLPRHAYHLLGLLQHTKEAEGVVHDICMASPGRVVAVTHDSDILGMAKRSYYILRVLSYSASSPRRPACKAMWCILPVIS